MPTVETKIHQGPDAIQVSVVMLREAVSGNPWIQERWRALGVMQEDATAKMAISQAPVVDESEQSQFLWPGLMLPLYRDEAESYYHNLMSTTPALYVVTRTNERGLPEPFLVTASFDAAHAYIEGDEDVFNVSLAPEIYRWVETFVLEYYLPEKKYKRKLNNWKQTAR